jgi:hypothetical protein
LKTLSRVLHLSVLLLVLQARSVWGVEIPTDAPTRVADVGDPARVPVEGVQIFTEGDIRRALQTDLDYLVASHLEGTLAECLATIEDRVRAGYRGCGFRAVAIQARFDLSAGRIVAKVTEGPRSRCGELQVTGLKSIPVAHFTRRFAEELTPAKDQTTPPYGALEDRNVEELHPRQPGKPLSRSARLLEPHSRSSIPGRLVVYP